MDRPTRPRGVPLTFALTLAAALVAAPVASAAPVHTTYLWHMHQPIYWPDESTWTPEQYEKAYETIVLGHSLNDEAEIFGKADRIGDYQYYPRDAINSILDIPDAGAQVSFAGSLIENITSLGDNGWNGGAYAPNWYASFREARGWTTSGGRSRCDMVLVGHHHGINPLMDENAFRKELQIQKAAYPGAWGDSNYSVGFFPAEMCFSERLIPVLEEEGVVWSVVPDLHIARACADYPYSANLDNCDPPNPADQINPAQGYYYSQTIPRGVTLRVPPPYGFRPHYARYVDPETGAESRIVVVPAANAASWNEGYGLYGTGEIDAIASYNDPSHPMLFMFAHDGDNAWSGGFSYWYENVTQFSHSAVSQGYEPTVVAEYLADHPIDTSDVVHVEDGGWVNADGDFGSPQYINWNWPLYSATGGFDIENGWAVDERNWAILTAAQNRVETAESIGGLADPARIQNPSLGANSVEKAWHFLLAGYESGYMYYGSALDFEVKQSIACNNACDYADPVIAGGTDTVGPTVWLPQRLPYNPGGYGGGSLWGYPGGPGAVMTQDFHVWTFVYDVSGLESVDLKYRVDADGTNPMTDDENETFAGGAGVGSWQTMAMTPRSFPAGNVYSDPELDFFVMPDYIADQYTAHMTGFEDVLLDYYVEATDGLGHVKRSPIQHVWVGQGGSAPGDTCVWWTPVEPEAGSAVTVYYDVDCRGILPGDTDPVRIHIGHSNWQDVLSPDPAMTWDAGEEAWSYTYSIPGVATSVEFVFNDGAGNWDNNGGGDWSVPVTGGGGGEPGYEMDGQLDAEAELVGSSGTMGLYVDFDGEWLYIATQPAGGGNDHFVLFDDDPAARASAPWAKAGTVAGRDYFLAQEGDNGWSGWFDGGESVMTSANVVKASGAWLEGAINVVGLYGALPDTVFVAATAYGTGDGGALNDQAPEGDGDGNVERPEYFPVPLTQTGVVEPGVQTRVFLARPAPNPFTTSTRISFFLPQPASVRLTVYDVSGRVVRDLDDGVRSAGEHEVVWDGRDGRGRAVPSGIYFYRLMTSAGTAERKAVVLR